MGPFVHVELTAQDPGAVARFYAEAFGLPVQESPFLPGYYLLGAGEGSGAGGAVMSREYQDQAAIAWVEVDDIETARSRVVAGGGKVTGEVNEIPGQGRVCYVSDPEGAVLGLKEPPR